MNVKAPLSQWLTLCLTLFVASACSPQNGGGPSTSAASSSEAAPLAQVATENPTSQRAAVPIATCTVAEGSVPRYLYFTGELRGAKEAMLAADVAGKVVAAPIERGSVVKEGDVVLKLDNRAATLALREAEAALTEANLKADWARDELTRNQSMAKSNAISALEFERLKLNRSSTESAVAAASARRDTAKKALSDTELRAPFTGVVVERLTEVGEFITSSTGVARLVAAKDLRLIIDVPETDVGQVSEGQLVSFTVPAFPSATFNGTVKYLGAALRESTRDLVIEAVLPNADGRLKPGMFAEGRLALAEQRSLMLPVAALRADGRVHKVFVVKDGAVEERLVEIGEQKEDHVEIRQGVSAGEVVLLSPGIDATDGMKVALAPSL